jgi:hypothetical protein
LFARTGWDNVARMPSRACLPALVLSLLPLAGCASPTPSHYTRLWLQGETGEPIVGTSTEDGVLLIAEPGYAVGTSFEIQFPVGNSLVRDWGRIDRLNDNLAVVRPVTARLREGRIATSLPQPGEQVYLALRDELDEPLMQPVVSWLDGRFGDWITVPERDAESLARDYRGTGLYVQRDDRWEIIGVLAGLLARDDSDPQGATALGYVGLLEMSRILPDRIRYLEHDTLPLRPDFEFGVPLQPGDIDLTPPETPEAPPAADTGAGPDAGTGGQPPRR